MREQISTVLATQMGLLVTAAWHTDAPGVELGWGGVSEGAPAPWMCHHSTQSHPADLLSAHTQLYSMYHLGLLQTAPVPKPQETRAAGEALPLG